MPPANAPPDAAIISRQRRGVLLRALHRWHWISAAIALTGMLGFAITGITLNHAARIEAKPRIEHRAFSLPAAQLQRLAAGPATGHAPLPPSTADWLDARLGHPIGHREAEWSADEIYLSLPGPGRDGWLSIQRTDGAVEYERTERGWISYFNDLHKGRNTGAAWAWFIDLFALACIVFAVSGLWLLALHARQRRMTWPWVGLGALIPGLLALLSIH